MVFPPSVLHLELKTTNIYLSPNSSLWAKGSLPILATAIVLIVWSLRLSWPIFCLANVHVRCYRSVCLEQSFPYFKTEQWTIHQIIYQRKLLQWAIKRQWEFYRLKLNVCWFPNKVQHLVLCPNQSRIRIQVSCTWSQNKYSTRSPTPCRRLWCWCPRPSKRAWKMFTSHWRCWCRFYEEKRFVVNFGTWTMNQNALWQLKSPQTKIRKTKTAC